jgi:hypothetical protein
MVLPSPDADTQAETKIPAKTKGATVMKLSRTKAAVAAASSGAQREPAAMAASAAASQIAVPRRTFGCCKTFAMASLQIP